MKEKPDVLSGEEMDKAYCLADLHEDKFGHHAIAQAQRDADVEWYRDKITKQDFIWQQQIERAETEVAREIEMILLKDVEHMGHFGVIRDWTIKLKSGVEIGLCADVVKQIVEHENKEAGKEKAGK